MAHPDPPARGGEGSANRTHPERIGPYRIVDVLGEGGMGVVYLAEQSEPVRRNVALKILKAGMDTEQVVRRFDTERQALAVMDHPGIAKVFDGGATEQGRPYFVMELVEGIPLTRYCDERQLGVRERVGLMVQVCRAIQHAHQKGVIHRDLKPSNVLVTQSDGRPLVKVIDFGIARAVTDDADGHTRVTELDQALGTPAYMSPEQIEGGRDIDTRTDVYAMGVLLYELLAGARPFEVGSQQGWARFAQALAQEAPTPSTRFQSLDTRDAVAARRGTDPTSLRRDLKGDLDWIVMRAIEKDRERRYETANGLGLDLERFLAHEPVLARPPTVRYRAGKFVRRHRIGVAFTATLVALLAGSAVAQTIQAERTRQARDLADARRQQAEGLIDFMLGDLRGKLAPLGRLDVLDDVGQQALAYFAALPEEEFTDDELLARSRALYQIGEVEISAGRAQEAEAAWRESLRLARELSERAPDDPDRLFGLSQSHFWVGYAAWQARDLDAAEVEFRAYLTIAERLVAHDRENDDYRMELGYAHSNLGSLHEARGDLEAAAEAFRLTLGVKQDLVERRPDDVNWLGELAETHNTLAVVYRRAGDYELALAEHEREMEIKERILERDPTHAYWRFRRAVGLNFTALVRLQTGDLAGAEALLAPSIATLDSLVRHDPENAAWRREVANVRRRRGYVLAHLGRGAEADRAFTRSMAELDGVIAADSTAFDWRRVLAGAHTDVAIGRLALGDLSAAEREALGALDLASAIADPGRDLRVERTRAELALARALAGLGRAGEAEALYAQAVLRAESLVTEPGGVEFRPLLAEAYLGSGRSADGRRELDLLARQGYREPHLMRLVNAAPPGAD
jgi:eukaryotic-like serine/threonine-protein kinase